MGGPKQVAQASEIAITKGLNGLLSKRQLCNVLAVLRKHDLLYDTSAPEAEVKKEQGELRGN